MVEGNRHWQKVNKFTPRCVEARLLGFCLRSSRYIVVDFGRQVSLSRDSPDDSFEDKWKIASPSDLPTGARGGVNPTAQPSERANVDVPAPGPDHEPLPRRLYLKQR